MQQNIMIKNEDEDSCQICKLRAIDELQHDIELSRGKYIIDKRTLTGIVLSDFVYDHMASSKNITLNHYMRI